MARASIAPDYHNSFILVPEFSKTTQKNRPRLKNIIGLPAQNLATISNMAGNKARHITGATNQENPP
jgi:hypothetical protein